MRNEKQLPLCPVTIKQEPTDHSDADVAGDNYTSGSYNNQTRHTAVDLRARTTPSRRGDAAFRNAAEVTSDAGASRDDDVSPRMMGKGCGRASSRGLATSPPPTISPATLADDLKNHIMSLASASRDLPTAGKTSWLEAVEGGADSTCTDCGARFESARAYRAHRLTHHILMPERGAEDRGSNGGEDSPAFDDESGQGAGFSGLGLAADGSGFVCEECKAHFTSRDTYAMHMLLRAKNEACFPCRSGSLAVTNTTTDASSRNLLTSSSSSVNMTSAVPLLGKRSPKELKHEPRSEISRTDGLLMEATGRHKLADSPKSLGHELLTDVARAADYGATWWSKYMPWVTMGMATGGGGLVGGDTEGVGPPLPLVCYVCGEIFSSRDSLAMHVLFHTRDMPATVPDTQPSWHKPLTSNAMLAMGQAAMRQFQHGTSYNNHSLVTASFNHRQQQLSPTVVAVASAAAAAAAAVTPVTSSSFSSVQSSLQRPEASSQVDKAGANVSKDVNGRSQHNATGPHTDFDDGLKKTKWNHDSESSDTSKLLPKNAPTDRNSFCLLPRGSSAPAPTTLTSQIANSKSPFSSFYSLHMKNPEKPRPMSADHVVYNSPLLSHFSNGAVDTGGRLETGSRGDLNGASKVKDVEWGQGRRVGSRSGSDSQLQRSSTSVSTVYRLQRLKRLRMAKNPYRRPAARGRPPMTIYGTAGRRHSGQNHQQNSASHSSAFSQTVSQTAMRADPAPHSTATPSTTPSSSTGGARKMAAMLQLLTSHGHEVSACVHCEVVFADRTLFQLHMGLHNVNNPWQCNACGLVCSSRLHFATHALHY